MQKSIILLSLICFIHYYGIAQLAVTPNDSVEINSTQTDPFEPTDLHIDVINTSSFATTFTWELKNQNIPSGWALQLCDNNNCYDLQLGTGPYETLSVGAGDTLDMKFQFNGYCVSGSGWADVVCFNTNDSANATVNLHYKANIVSECVNSIYGTSQASIRVFPNPFQSSFVVSGLENAGNVSFEVYDMKGSLVPAKVLSATNSSIDIALPDAPEGSYILKATDASGELISTTLLHKTK